MNVLKNKSEFDFKSTFPPLGHSEHHFNKYPNHPWLKTRDEIVNWLDNNLADMMENTGDLAYILNEDMTVDITTNFFIEDFNEDYLPIQICEVSGVEIKSGNLKSLIGTPYSVFNDFVIENNKIENLIGLNANVCNDFVSLSGNKITSFIGMPEKIRGYFDVRENPIESFEGFTYVKNFEWFEEKPSERTLYYLDELKSKADMFVFKNSFDNFFEVISSKDKFWIGINRKDLESMDIKNKLLSLKSEKEKNNKRKI